MYECLSGVGYIVVYWVAVKGYVGALTWLFDACLFDFNFFNVCGVMVLYLVVVNG